MHQTTRRSPYLAAALIALVCAPLGAVHGQGIAGYVRDSAGQPLLGATVTTLPGDATARTDDAGRFVLPLLEPGEYRLTVRRVGYLPSETRVSVQAGVRARVEIELQRRAPTPRANARHCAFAR